MKIRTMLALALAAPFVLTAAPSTAIAQDVKYETVTKLDLPGALGTAVRFAARLGGGSMESVETTYIRGRMMRTDADDTSTILDLDEGRFTMLDHKAKTYMTMTFAEMVARAEEAAREATAGQRAPDDRGAAHNVDFRFSVDPANQRERMHGYNAERFFMTMQMEGEFTPEGATQREQAGSLVLLTDIWSSKDMPAYQALSNFQEASAHRFAESSSAMMQALASAFADDPNMRVAFEKTAAEAAKMDGMPLLTVTRFVMVPPGQRFERDLALNPPSQDRGNVAQQAGRAALGRMTGRLGGRQQQQAEPQQEEAPSQATILTVTSEVRNVTVAPLDAQLFTVPDGYRRVEDPSQMQ